MPEVHHIIVQIRPANPSRKDPGQRTPAAYTFENSIVTLVDPQGIPVRDDNGKLYQHTIGPGTADAETLACVLTKEFRKALRGTSSPGGPINYPRRGWC
jgi:hypothetical protein